MARGPAGVGGTALTPWTRCYARREPGRAVEAAMQVLHVLSKIWNLAIHHQVRNKPFVGGRRVPGSGHSPEANSRLRPIPGSPLTSALARCRRTASFQAGRKGCGYYMVAVTGPRLLQAEFSGARLRRSRSRSSA